MTDTTSSRRSRVRITKSAEGVNAVTTLVLDSSRGQPAGGVPLLLEVRSEAGNWKTITKASTDKDGRAKLLASPVTRGTYRLTFDTAAYFRAWNMEGFYPLVEVVFEVRDLSQPYHIPLFLSPYGYSTYKA
jgi:5-hydroxyisourate hydrolase